MLRKEEDTLNNKPRRPWIAALLTLLVTGLGHLYAGNPQKGIILFGIGQFLFLVFAAAVNLITASAVFVFSAVTVGTAFIIFYVIDAVLIAKREKENYEPAKYNRWFVYIGCIVIATSLIVTYRSAVILPYFVQAFKLPTGTMEPTLLIGDHFLVGKLIYKTTEPKRGDIIVFKYPRNPEIAYIKRLVGEPGNKVEIIGRIVYINGNPLKENYTQYIDPRSVNEHYGPVSVPAEQYFVMGDNRDNSMDSRFWGFVPRKNVIGKPLFIYWSYQTPRDEYLQSRISGLPNQGNRELISYFTNTRWNRTFRIIK